MAVIKTHLSLPRSLPLLLAGLLVAACGSSAPRVPAAADRAASVTSGEPDAVQSSAAQRPALTTAVLPSMVRSGTLNAAASLLQRPVAGAVVLRPLATGETVQLLGELSNAEGRWLSVAVAGEQGWLRASDVAQP